MEKNNKEKSGEFTIVLEGMDHLDNTIYQHEIDLVQRLFGNVLYDLLINNDRQP